jgi:hypothetical protein
MHSYVFRQWVEISSQLNKRLRELHPINIQINDGNLDVTNLEETSRRLDEIGRLFEYREELLRELTRLISR